MGDADPFNYFPYGPQPRDSPPDANGPKPPPLPHVTPPAVTVNDGWFEPSATGDVKQSGDPPGAGEKPPVVPKFSVTVQSLRDAEEALKRPIETAATTYESLRTLVNSEKAWIFQQESVNSTGHTETHGSINSIQSGPITDTTSALPELVAMTPEMSALLENALLSIADVIHMTGTYVARLNDAVQMYTKADKDSFLPPP